MAMPTVESEIKLVQEQLKAQARKEIEGAWRVAARTRLGRELSAKENKALTEEINKLFFGREEWLKQMREALRREQVLHSAPYRPEDEEHLNRTVNNLLQTNPEFIAKFKYEADAIAMSESQAFASDPAFGAIQGFFSKISDFLENTPFAFLGKLIAFVLDMFSKLMPAVKELGEKLNPQKTPANWFNEGAFDDADVELRKQEAQLLTKMENALLEMQATAPQEDVKAAQDLLNEFRQGLSAYENEEFLAKARDQQYWQDNLKFRMALFERYSSKSKELLEIHAQKQVLDKKIAAGDQEVQVLEAKSRTIPADTPEQLTLGTRLAGLQAAIAQLRPKQEVLRDNENTLLHNFPQQIKDVATPLINAHKLPFEAEQHRQHAPRRARAK